MQSLQTSMKELIKSDWIPGQDLLIVMQFFLFYFIFFEAAEKDQNLNESWLKPGFI